MKNIYENKMRQQPTEELRTFYDKRRARTGGGLTLTLFVIFMDKKSNNAH